MNTENNKNLDELITGAIVRDKLEFDFDKWKNTHQEKIRTFQSQTTGRQTYQFNQPSNIWRILIKNPITKLAVAAVIIIIVTLLLHNGSINIASITWADMQKAFLAKSWVHLEYDNSEESWYNLINGNTCHKQLYPWGESFVYINRTDNLRQRYTPEHGQHIREDRPSTYKDNIIPPYEPETAWETIVGHWEKVATQGGSKYYDVTINTDTLDGKTTVRFDIYNIDALDRKLLTQQLWADPTTKLPIKIRKKSTSQEQKDQKREYITGVFSFPDSGPLSIYDLGVPRDLPVAKSYDKVADPKIEKILETARQYYEDFPKRCRAVTWQNDRESEIMVVWRDGEKVRLHIYFNLMKEKYLQYHLDLPTTVDEILAWTKSQPPIGIYLDDEVRC